MSKFWSLAALFSPVLIATPLLLARGGGGRGGPFGGGFNNNQQQQQKPDPAKQAEQLRKKVQKYLDDGFAALRASATADALEDFSDAIQLDPRNPLGHLGLALAKVQKGRIDLSEPEFSLAQSDARSRLADPQSATLVVDPNDPAGRFAKPSLDPRIALNADLRVATYDLAAAYSRTKEKPRALVMMDKLMTQAKPPEEVLVNAQRTILANMDGGEKSAIPALAGLEKNLETASKALYTAHAPLRRWGVTWMPLDQITAHRAARETEPFAKQLPFFMPGDEILPEGGKKGDLENPLAAIVIPGEATAAPDTAPTAIASAGQSPATQPAAPVAAPGTPLVVADATPPAPLLVPAPAPAPAAPAPVRSTLRTVSGAAFAVAPDLLITSSHLVSNAKAIQLQGTDGVAVEATVADVDEADGIALIRCNGTHFTPLVLADTLHAGTVTVAAFSAPSIFEPKLQLIKGVLANESGQIMLRTQTHPRSAGCPILNAQNEVVGVFIGTREDTVLRLPVARIEAVRKLLGDKAPAAAIGVGPGPEGSVLDLSATRED